MVERSPKLGASWEGFALETMVRRLRHARTSERFLAGVMATLGLDRLTLALAMKEPEPGSSPLIP